MRSYLYFRLQDTRELLDGSVGVTWG